MSLHLASVLCLSFGSGWLGGWIAVQFSGTAPRLLPPLTAFSALALGLWATLALPVALLTFSIILGVFLLVLSLIDLLTFRLPDLLTLPLIALGLSLSYWIVLPPVIDRAAGAGLGYGVFAGLGWLYWRWRGQDGLGLGDAKLAAAGGAWLGWEALPAMVLLASLMGLAWALVRYTLRSDRERQPIAFGMPLGAAIWLTWLYGPISLPQVF